MAIVTTVGLGVSGTLVHEVQIAMTAVQGANLLIPCLRHCRIGDAWQVLLFAQALPTSSSAIVSKIA